MADNTPYHSFNRFDKLESWDYNPDFEKLDARLELRGSAADRPSSAPDGAKYVVDDPNDADHGAVYIYDSGTSTWNKQPVDAPAVATDEVTTTSGFTYDEDNGDLVIRDTDGSIVMRRQDGDRWRFMGGSFQIEGSTGDPRIQGADQTDRFALKWLDDSGALVGQFTGHSQDTDSAHFSAYGSDGAGNLIKGWDIESDDVNYGRTAFATRTDLAWFENKAVLKAENSLTQRPGWQLYYQDGRDTGVTSQDGVRVTQAIGTTETEIYSIDGGANSIMVNIVGSNGNNDRFTDVVHYSRSGNAVNTISSLDANNSPPTRSYATAGFDAGLTVTFGSDKQMDVTARGNLHARVE